MPLDPKHPFIGRRRSEITDDELEPLTDAEYEEYLLWGVSNALRHMVAEGMAEASVCPKTGELLYKINPDFKNSVDSI
jgi:hypothetical protein